MLSDAKKVIAYYRACMQATEEVREGGFWARLEELFTAYDKGRGLNLEAASAVVKRLSGQRVTAGADSPISLGELHYWLGQYHTALCSEPEGMSPGPDRSGGADGEPDYITHGVDWSVNPDSVTGKSTPAGHTTHSPGGSEGLPQAGDNEACPFCGIYPVSNGPELQHPTVKGCPLSDCLFNPVAWNRRTGEDKGA